MKTKHRVQITIFGFVGEDVELNLSSLQTSDKILDKILSSQPENYRLL